MSNSAMALCALLVVASALPGRTNAPTPERRSAVSAISRHTHLVERPRIAVPPRKITLILLEEFSQPGLVAVIRRTPGSDGEDMIVVKRNALSAEVVGSAIGLLANARKRVGTPARKELILVRQGVRIPPLSGPREAASRALVARLLGASRRAMKDIGDVPAVDVEASQVDGGGATN